MSIIKAILSRMFSSNWTYSADGNVRTHKVTGSVEHYSWDDWGGFWTEERQHWNETHLKG